jgi:sugar/nucleoside kinase (ribokinase family)
MKPSFKLLLKQGSEGSTLLWLSEGALQKVHVPALNFDDFDGSRQLVDTTGAGDTLTAAFAVKYGELRGKSETGELTLEEFRDCMAFGTKAAFICISRFGASNSMPTLTEVEQLM